MSSIYRKAQRVTKTGVPFKLKGFESTVEVWLPRLDLGPLVRILALEMNPDQQKRAPKVFVLLKRGKRMHWTQVRERRCSQQRVLS
jgi:hypothetical protein